MSDRKYRQSGYQDSGSQSSGSRDGGSRNRGGQRGQAGPRSAPQGPRGRGLGKPTANVFRCAVCGHKSAVADIAAEATCGKCGTDLHTCTHCVHFDTSSPNECRQPVEEPISSKAKRNLCPLFAPRTTQEFAAEPKSTNAARSAFDALFD